MKWQTRPTIRETFDEHVSPEPNTGCFLWTRAVTRQGYGHFFLEGKGNRQRTVLAHRYAYEREHGRIPAALQIDHLCRNRLCVNPRHMEPVLPRVNFLRGNNRSAVSLRTGRCCHGHPQEAHWVNGCRICNRARPSQKNRRKG